MQARPSFSQRRTWERGRSLLFGALACLGRHTVSGLLCATGQQFVDWSAAYRLFEARRFDPEALFSPVRTAVLERLKQAMPVIASLDDTLVYKRGRKVAGASWRRDPLGPPFRPNFSWAQRFVQISLLLPTQGAPGPARAIPADLVHAPTAKKPSQNDPPELWEEYRQKQKQMRTSQVGSERIAHLRTALDDDERSQARELLVAVDGGYANQTFLRELPAKTTVVARIRKDARLFSEPAPSAPKRGRRRLYGERLPTPEELRHDESIPWMKVEAFAAGAAHTFEVKRVGPVRSTTTGEKDVQIVIIRPLAYRPKKGARLLYRDPAYLLCTDPDLPIETLLQAYLWRWEIEVNFREEKTILGMGEAQVRTESAAALAPSFVAAAYGMLHAAAAQADITESGLPLPKWRRNQPPRRASTTALINRLRADLWTQALGLNKNGFAATANDRRSPLNSQPHLASAVCYAER